METNVEVTESPEEEEVLPAAAEDDNPGRTIAEFFKDIALHDKADLTDAGAHLDI